LKPTKSHKLLIIKQLLLYDDKLHKTKINLEARGYSNIKKANLMIAKDPNALFVGLIFDQGIKAEKAWSSAYFLKQRLGYFDIKKYYLLGTEKLVEVCKIKPSLHRYNYMGKWLW